MFGSVANMLDYKEEEKRIFIDTNRVKCDTNKQTKKYFKLT